MSRRIALFALVFVAAVAFAQRTGTSTAPAKPWANKLFLPGIEKTPAVEAPTSIEHNFGTVPFWDVPIQVIDVRLECGCLKAFPPNRVLEPNEKAEFTATMNAGLFKGLNTKKMLVTIGPNYQSTAELRFSATSREDVALSAPGQIDFGIVSQGDKSDKSITLKYTGASKDWKVTGFEALGPNTVADVKEVARGFLGTDYRISVSLKDSAASGSMAETITLMTNDPATPTVVVPIIAKIQAPVTVAPNRIAFQNVTLGKFEIVRVLVKANANCTLSSIPDDGDGLSAEVFPVSSAVHIVTIKYDPKKAAPAFTKDLKHKTNLPGNPEAILTIGVK